MALACKHGRAAPWKTLRACDDMAAHLIDHTSRQAEAPRQLRALDVKLQEVVAVCS